MPASTVETSVRQAIATALSSVSANVYAYVPETPIVPRSEEHTSELQSH